MQTGFSHSCAAAFYLVVFRSALHKENLSDSQAAHLLQATQLTLRDLEPFAERLKAYRHCTPRPIEASARCQRIKIIGATIKVIKRLAYGNRGRIVLPDAYWCAQA